MIKTVPTIETTLPDDGLVRRTLPWSSMKITMRSMVLMTEIDHTEDGIATEVITVILEAEDGDAVGAITAVMVTTPRTTTEKKETTVIESHLLTGDTGVIIVTETDTDGIVAGVGAKQPVAVEMIPMT